MSTSVSFYDVTVDVAIRALETLKLLLAKGAAHPDAASFPASRLVEDMLPFSYQVTYTCFWAKKMAMRFAGMEPETRKPWEEGMDTMEKLQAYVDETLAFLRTVDKATVDAAAHARSELEMGPMKFDGTGLGYAVGWGLPNIWFHLAMAYAIMRAKGVDIGKRDWVAKTMEGYMTQIA